jgi:hypothetical protein
MNGTSSERQALACTSFLLLHTRDHGRTKLVVPVDNMQHKQTRLSMILL